MNAVFTTVFPIFNRSSSLYFLYEPHLFETFETLFLVASKSPMLKIVLQCSDYLLMTGIVADTTFEEEMHKSISSIVLLLDFLNVCLIDILHWLLKILFWKPFFISFFFLWSLKHWRFNQIKHIKHFIKHGKSRQRDINTEAVLIKRCSENMQQNYGRTPVNLLYIFRTPFLMITSGWLLL